MLVHGFAPASNLHLGYTVPSVRSSLRRVVRLRALVVALPIMGRRFAPPISATLHDDPMSFAGGAPMGRELKTCELRA